MAFHGLPWQVRLLTDAYPRLSAARPRTPTRPRTPRSEARWTLAPPSPRLVDGKLWGIPGGRPATPGYDAKVAARRARAVSAALAAGGP